MTHTDPSKAQYWMNPTAAALELCGGLEPRAAIGEPAAKSTLTAVGSGGGPRASLNSTGSPLGARIRSPIPPRNDPDCPRRHTPMNA